MTGVRVLFFGGLWSQVFLQRLLELSAAFRDDQVLIIRGGRGDARPASMAGNKVDISTLAIPFNRINSVIATADVGLALYPIDEPNSRCSAFASEKVARYLQCGLPFIAFRNEDYAFLQSETGCCELVTDYAEVPQAVNRIVDNYDQYCSGAANAFARFYSRDKTAPELVRQLDILSSGGHA